MTRSITVTTPSSEETWSLHRAKNHATHLEEFLIVLDETGTPVASLSLTQTIALRNQLEAILKLGPGEA